MSKEEKLLTICIPTYNRAAYLKEALQFMVSEVNADPKILDDVNFVVSNNASTDKTTTLFDEAAYSFFYFKTNEKNLGLVGNLTSVLTMINTKYIWYVGDDDKLDPGVIRFVLSKLKEYVDLQFLFLNFSIGGKKQ